MIRRIQPELHASEIRWQLLPLPRAPVGQRVHDVLLAATDDAEAIELLANIALDLHEDAESFRLLARHAIEALHEQHIELTRLRQQHHHLLDEYRKVRDHDKRNVA